MFEMDYSSDAYVHRIARYYRRIRHLNQFGAVRVSSDELADYMNISPSQVRTDLSKLGVGQSGYGYKISALSEELEKLLGIDKINEMILIGVGKLGQALLAYPGFYRYGFRFRAAFDINPSLQGKTFGYLQEPIQSASELPRFLAKNKIPIAVLAVDPESVQPIVDILVDGNIEAIWNFASNYPDVPEDVVLENVRILESLLKLSYQLEDDNESFQKGEKET